MGGPEPAHDKIVTDRGHIFRTEPAHNWVAVFSAPHAPNYVVLPVVLWAHVKRNGEEIVEPMLPEAGAPQLVFLHELDPQLRLHAMVDLALYTSAIFTDASGKTGYDYVCAAAAEAGKEAARIS